MTEFEHYIYIEIRLDFSTFIMNIIYIHLYRNQT
jgi:hypothetical protein